MITLYLDSKENQNTFLFIFRVKKEMRVTKICIKKVNTGSTPLKLTSTFMEQKGKGKRERGKNINSTPLLHRAPHGSSGPICQCDLFI